MPSLRINENTKLRLQSLMANYIQTEIQNSTPEKRLQIIGLIVKNKYGVTHDYFLNVLMDNYKQT